MWRTVTKGVEKWGSELSSQIKIEIENYWKDYVTKSINQNLNGKKFYVLSMFPYPSGHLHMGHVRVYSISDSVARFHKMNGMNVIHPMGWDSFGLPAENAAIERGLPPEKWTKSNIAKMKEQLMELGCNFDWDREINTCDPKYYRWTQYLFLELYKAGLVYKKGAYVNWDPVDKTVLADEQVDINGCSWRSGAKVEKKVLNQWFIKTTYFAKQLYDGLGDLPILQWRDIIPIQKHWIGECNGITIDFELTNNNNNIGDCINTLNVWTDKPESLLYCKFIAVSSQNILNRQHLIANEGDKFKRLSIIATNPITNKRIPVIVSDEIEYPEGSSTHMGCPELNEQDKIIAMQAEIDNDEMPELKISAADFFILCKNVCEKAKVMNVGGYPVSPKLKDWLVSRQRFWGTPIPIVHCEHCGEQPVPVDQLPVTLPNIETLNYKRLSLKSFDDWINTSCPTCGLDAKRETDTLDTFVDSSWYFLRYLDSHNTSLPFSIQKAWENMPVDMYIGGKEHAALHLYYARFVNHFLHSIGKVPEREPFKSMIVQGMIMGKSFKIKESGKYIIENEVNIVDEEKGIAFTKKENLPVEITWEKMSKSKLNGVDPSSMFKEFGCDTTRLLMLGNVSPMSHRHWTRETFPGILNWQNRIWNTVNNFIVLRSTSQDLENIASITSSDEFKKSESSIRESRNYFVVSILFNYKYTHQLSVAISRMQGLVNVLMKVPKNYTPISREFEELLAAQIIMLAPMAPHFASELWSGFVSAKNRIDNSNNSIDWDKNVLDQKWPTGDPNYKLKLIGTVDGGECCRIELLPSVMNNLTHNDALNMVLKEKKLNRKIKGGIANSDFKIYTDCRAVIAITTNRQVEKLEKEKEKEKAVTKNYY